MFGRKFKNECKEIREKFSPYLDGRLESVEQDRVKYHAEICEECQYELKSLKAMRELLHLVPVAPAPRSFKLMQAPSRKSWFRFEMPTISFEIPMRVAATAAVIVFAIVISLDLSGVLSQQTTEPEEIISQTTDPIPIIQVTPTPSVTPVTLEDLVIIVGVPEAVPPDPNSDIDNGIAILQIPEVQPDLVDPNGGSGVYSPTPRSVTPSWLLPLEIAAGIMVCLFGTVNLLVWQKKRTTI